MGIVKIRHRGALNKNHDQQTSCALTVDGLVHEDRLLTGKDGADEFDDSDLADVGCELAMVGDQMCSIPYDLYDLSDLKDVLSLETWNSCLTEEERFHLASYLPDMDHETFVLTIKELLSGANLFFGSPLEKLFHGLQGGLYSVQVSPVREGLRFLEKQGHYHSLRLYHENMTRRFGDMSKAWSNCLSSTTVEDRIRIWNKKKDQKPVLLVDLNAFPADEETLSKGDKRLEDFPLLKKTKYMDEGLNLHNSAIDLNRAAAKTKPKGKGVLKLRSVDTNATSNHRMQKFPSDSWEPCRRVPKGVLKIKPKSDPFNQPERPVTTPIHTSAGPSGIHTSKFATPLFASKCKEENADHNLAYLPQSGSDEKQNRSLEQSTNLNDGQREEFLKMSVESFSDSHSFPRKINMVLSARSHNASEPQKEIFPLTSKQKSRMKCNEPVGIGKFRNDHSSSQNSNQRRRVLFANPSDSGLSAPQNRQKLTLAYHEVPGEIPRISTVDTFQHCLKHAENKHKDGFDAGLNTTTDSTAVSGEEQEVIFPITYRRKKACTKFNPMGSPKEPAMITNLESIVSNRTECNLIGKAKTVKIKVKGWNNHNAQYKQGLLSGLQHGSPST